MKQTARGLAGTSRPVFALLLFTLAVTLACGSVARHPTGTPSASTGAAGNTVAELGDADAGRTVQLQRDEVVSVALHEASGFTPWSHPASSDSSVLTPIADPRAASVRGVTLASFRGAGAGTAQITSSASPACTPGSVCPALARGWFVTVVVR
jgi:hypothetical protein